MTAAQLEREKRIVKKRTKQAPKPPEMPAAPYADAPPVPEMVEEWQVLGGDGNTIHVFTNRGSVFGYLAREWQTFVVSWDPTRTCVLRLEVRHVMKEKSICRT